MRVNRVNGWSLFLGGLALAAMAPARAQDRMMPPRGGAAMMQRITVTGHGEVRRAPDLVTLSLGVEERGPDVAGPRQRAAQKAQNAIQALLKAGVKREDIQTSNFSVSRQWEQDPTPQASSGTTQPSGKYVFVVRNTVSVRTPMVDKAGDLLDAVVKAGFNDINGPSFELKDNAEAQRAALTAAIEDARAKADAAASAAGVKVSGLESVTENGSSMPPPRPMYMAKMAGASADFASTPIEGGQITVSEDVTVSFRF
jgi:uncharacterized protein YggE